MRIRRFDFKAGIWWLRFTWGPDKFGRMWGFDVEEEPWMVFE